MRVVKAVRLVVCVTAAVGAAAAGMGLQAFAAGDPAAKAEAIAAFQKLNAVASFRIKWTSREGTGVAEFVQPDKRHFSGKSDQGSFEIVGVGTNHATRYDVPGMPAGWRCSKGRSLPTYIDIDKMRRNTTVEVVRKPDTVIDGTPVSAYADASSGDVLYVSKLNGLPRRIQNIDKDVLADFYDFGAPITIALPPCG